MNRVIPPPQENTLRTAAHFIEDRPIEDQVTSEPEPSHPEEAAAESGDDEWIEFGAPVRSARSSP